MPDIASWNPPAELLQLGDPDRAHWSRRISSTFLWTSASLILLALAGEGALLYAAAFTNLIPPTQQYLIYLGSAVILAFAGGVIVNISWYYSRRPNFFFGFYPTGLVMLTGGRRWGFLAWRDVYSFDTKYTDPLITLEDRTQMVVVHDFPDPEEFYADLARYVEAKHRVKEDLPITASLVKYDKATRRQLLVGAMLIGITLAASIVYFEHLDLVIAPDRTVSHEQLVNVTRVDQLPRAWMGVECPKTIPTAGRFTSRKNHVTYVESRVVLIPINGRYLMANVRNTFEGKGMLRGEFSVWKDISDHDGNQKHAVFEQVAAEFPQYRGQLLPVQLDATVVSDTYAQLLALSLAIGLVVGLGLLARGVWTARHSRPRVDLRVPAQVI